MTDWPADSVERRPVASLIPYARNARMHSAEQVTQVAASIKEWGWTTPVLIDESAGIIAGHCRVLAAQVLGLDEVPVIVARGWTDAQKQAYVIADNKLGLNSAWDDGLLAGELSSLEAGEFNMDLIGFSTDELTALLKPVDARPPGEFGAYDESIETEHQCPRCGYLFSGGRVVPVTAAASEQVKEPERDAA